VFWLDERLFFLINGLAERSAAFDGIMTFMVSDYFTPLIMTMVVFALWFQGNDAAELERIHRAIFSTATAVGFACAVVKLMNLGIDRLRPFEAHPESVKLLFYTCTDPSFPSNSAAIAFAFAMGTWFIDRRASIFLFAIAALWSFSRAYCGVHYPLDIVGGAAIGILIVWPAIWVNRLLHWVPDWVHQALVRLHLA